MPDLPHCEGCGDRLHPPAKRDLVKCPGCEAPSIGVFCGHCGTRLVSATQLAVEEGRVSQDQATHQAIARFMERFRGG